MIRWLKSNSDILLIVAVAFCLRLSVVELLHRDGYTSDEKEYISLATKLAEGKPFVDTNSEWSTKAPLYPFALSLVFRLCGNGLLIPHLIGCLLGAVAVFLSFRLCFALFDNRLVALICAALVGLHPSFIVYADILQTETVYIVLMLLTFLFVERMLKLVSVAEAAMLGIISAAVALTRAVFFGFFPLLLVVVAGVNRKKVIVWKTVVAFVVWCLMLLPWTMRNYDIHGTFVPISSWGGISLLLGNNPYSNGTWSGKPGFHEWFASKAAENGIDLEKSTEIERSTLGRELAQEFIFAEPVKAVKLAIQKSYMHWIFPISNSDSNVKLQAVCVVADIIFYVFGGIGLIVAGVKRKNLAPVVAAILFFTAMQAILHCESRYRLPIMPFIALYSAVGISVFIDTRKAKEFFHITRNTYLAVSWVSVIVFVYAFTAWQFLSGKI